MESFKDNTEKLEDVELLFSGIHTHLKNKGGSVEEDLAFAKLIVANHLGAINYFMSDYSIQLLRYIVINILHLKTNFEYGEPANAIAGDYYIFIAAPFDELKDNIPQWHKIDLYKGENNARLYSYVSYIAKNHFIRNKKKYEDREKDSLELLEFIDYDTLLGYDYAYDEIDKDVSETLQMVRKAFLNLKDRDQIVLQCLVINKMHWSEAFDKLRIYLNPKGPNNEWINWSSEEKQKAIDKYWNSKQKQDAMAGLKKRAITYITSQLKKIKEQKI